MVTPSREIDNRGEMITAFGPRAGSGRATSAAALPAIEMILGLDRSFAVNLLGQSFEAGLLKGCSRARNRMHSRLTSGVRRSSPRPSLSGDRLIQRDPCFVPPRARLRAAGTIRLQAIQAPTGAAQRRQPCQPVNWRVNALTVSTLFFMTCGWRSFARLPPAPFFAPGRTRESVSPQPRSNHTRQRPVRACQDRTRATCTDYHAHHSAVGRTIS
jgi:hypothetical protein